ncbi:hypothetical protein T230_11525 [Tannerella sp. oral taxon BU063 isolate Cell 1/3]|uniref:Uncharacterized protein n=1 Tax=Tannerella sp. oral taxon BU063 isolate Cell 1/3 TaxID=1411022 RepID=W2CJE8_9BACT|nr:hypothetical protein T230_11525 [Tannerella sp. oral taxon BU063 isolate Cell 1/3]
MGFVLSKMNDMQIGMSVFCWMFFVGGFCMIVFRWVFSHKHF